MARKLWGFLSKVMGCLISAANIALSKKKKKLTLFGRSRILQFVEIRPSVAVEGAEQGVI